MHCLFAHLALFCTISKCLFMHSCAMFFVLLLLLFFFSSAFVANKVQYIKMSASKPDVVIAMPL